MPDNPLPYLLIADLYLYERKLLEAISELEKAVPLVAPSGMGKEFAGRMNVLSSLAGDNADLLEPCGFLWIAAGQPEDALPFLVKAAGGGRSSGDSRRGANADQVLAALAGGWAAAVTGAMTFAEAARRLLEPEPHAPATGGEKLTPPRRGRGAGVGRDT